MISSVWRRCRRIGSEVEKRRRCLKISQSDHFWSVGSTWYFIVLVFVGGEYTLTRCSKYEDLGPVAPSYPFLPYRKTVDCPGSLLLIRIALFPRSVPSQNRNLMNLASFGLTLIISSPFSLSSSLSLLFIFNFLDSNQLSDPSLSAQPVPPMRYPLGSTHDTQYGCSSAAIPYQRGRCSSHLPSQPITR